MVAPKIKVRGIRQKSPSGYVLGRVSGGDGEIEFLSLSHLELLGIASRAQVNKTGLRSGFGFRDEGLFLAGEAFGSGVFHRDVTFSNGDPDTIVTALVPPTADAVLNIKTPDGFGVPQVIGTITFLAGQKTATVAWTGGSQKVLRGVVLSLFAPSSGDPTLADITGNVNGQASTL